MVLINFYKMKVIEFFGMPRAGKTGQINILSSFLRKKGINHYIITDREIDKEITIPLEATFEYHILFCNKILKKLILAKRSRKYKIIILDRGFLDGEAWFNLEYKQKKLSKSEKDTILRYLEALKKYVDISFLMIVDSDVAVTRYKNKGEIGKKKYNLKDYRNFMENLYKEYLHLKNKFKRNGKVIFLDGNKSIKDLHIKIKNKLQEKGII